MLGSLLSVWEYVYTYRVLVMSVGVCVGVCIYV